jgi:hypothetical protein
MAHAFISYSHSDEHIVKRLHAHMSQLKREGNLTSWFDGEILAGASLDKDITTELNKTDIFIAIVSPDYLNSAYCFDIEFQDALNRFALGHVRIVPVIAQPCDWKASPFGKFKAIPKDGKPISEWTNENNALLNVIDELRRLISTPLTTKPVQPSESKSRTAYKVKRDFDPVDNLNFRDESFDIIHEYFRQAIDEISGVNEIKARFVNDTTKQQFTCVITNRAKIGTTGYLSIGIRQGDHFGTNGITYALSERLSHNVFGNNFIISHDDYELFWSRYDMMSNNTQHKPQLKAKDIAELLWEEFIGQVGISC